jgi:hypothetical protein
MIFDMHGKPLFARHEAWASRHRPAFQDAVHGEAEVIMQAARRMFLHDEEITRGGTGFRSARLCGLFEITLLSVGLKRHRKPLCGDGLGRSTRQSIPLSTMVT